MRLGDKVKIKDFKDIDINLGLSDGGPVWGKEMEQFCGYEDKVGWINGGYPHSVRLVVIPYTWNNKWLYNIDGNMEDFDGSEFEI